MYFKQDVCYPKVTETKHLCRHNSTIKMYQNQKIKIFESRLDQYWKEHEGKYNFKSIYSPIAN